MTDDMKKDMASRIRSSFDQQQMMHHLGATLMKIEPGRVEIGMPFMSALTQQHGFIHAGAISTIADSACGYAALTLMPADAAVLTVEYKINLLSPAAGERFVARGRVIKSGRTLTVCDGEVVAITDGAEKPIAHIVATMIAVSDRALRD